MNIDDFFFNKKKFALQAKTVSFFKLEYQRLDEFLMNCWIDCEEDWFKVQMKYPELWDYKDRLEKRIAVEWQRLGKLMEKT
jgi:hypothetical protein